MENAERFSISFSSKVCSCCSENKKVRHKSAGPYIVLGRLRKPLFVFSKDGPKQNATSLLTPFSNIVFMLFQVVPLVLLSMVALITTYTKESDCDILEVVTEQYLIFSNTL